MPDDLRFAAPFAEADEAVVPRLRAAARTDAATDRAIEARATHLIEGIRDRAGGIGGLEDFLRDYGLSTKEGLALMVMAEALLRVPDTATQDALIEDKIGAGDWANQKAEHDTWLVSAATWGLGLSARIVHPSESPGGILSGLTHRLGAPAVRQGVRQAMRILGHQFVLGETIEEALKRARPARDRGFRHSYDMLGEGARTWDDARRYAQSYARAIDAIGRAAGNRPLPDRPGISVKLSALHPRYDPRKRREVMQDLVPRVVELARAAKSWDLNFTIDAEEAARLELSLEVIAAVFADEELRGWDGFGLAVQAYQKRALAVIDWVADLARAHDARMMVRLVKGAYWDTEVKLTQVEGAEDFPVFTRKAATDLSFEACAARMLAHRPAIYPQFATHNALTVATILEMAGGTDDFEFQRLHGMGEALYDQIGGDRGVPCRIYAPVGGHRDLLAYLVRRLLENGANSSFVARVGDRKVPVADLLERPAETLRRAGDVRHKAIARPQRLFGERKNSAGIEFGARDELDAALSGIAAELPLEAEAGPIIDGRALTGGDRVVSPVDGAPIGTARAAIGAEATAAMDAAAGHRDWAGTDVGRRAAVLRRAADLMEGQRDRLLAVLAREAGKTLDDGIAEIREAVDFLRYYADEAERLMTRAVLPGPVGEENVHTLVPRGVFVAIAPWNFPLAIFTGQVAAALAAGNCVAAKPAPQTPIIGAEAVRILHQAGVPAGALHFVPGGPEAGRALIAHPAVSGVVFTGSTATARAIYRQLADKDGPIVPLIAETGGINAMIVDATALPEQVSDDVVMSAFRSAGQRCSACRILHVQEDVADRVVGMIEGAARTLTLGDPTDPATDMGPIIDAEAKGRLEAHVKAMQQRGWVRYAGEAPDSGTFLGPVIVELPRGERLEKEVFGPVLHVKRWKPGEMDRVLDEINATGYGLTFAIHSRIDAVVQRATRRAHAGNIYVNRNQIGAIVGSQPFGGSGLSGTGPKAGGPLYLTRFVEERTVSTDTTAAGGNATLLGSVG
jgi:RHH-type proline utilization regulon transcriptional repressor/proline dehydrogenase/delta 1-pyrroline-5-carboxylate dehydrogenase